MVEDVVRVEAKESRPLNDYEAWSLPHISYRVAELELAETIRQRKVARDAEIEEWLPTSNLFDVHTDAGEEFILEEINGFRKATRTHANQFHVVWVPRTFAADADFPVALPEVSGLPWEPSEEDWVSATSFYRMYKADPIVWNQMRYWKQGVLEGVLLDGVWGGVDVEGEEEE